MEATNHQRTDYKSDVLKTWFKRWENSGNELESQ